MPSLPDDALIVRGGLNLPESLKIGTGVTIDSAGNLHGLSVNSAPGKNVTELAAGLPNRQIGVTTVGAVRAAGGEVEAKPTPWNSDHCQINGISAEVMHNLLNPPVPNPSLVK